MLVMMQMHGLRINVRLKCIVVVGQGWKLECHKTFSPYSKYAMEVIYFFYVQGITAMREIASRVVPAVYMDTTYICSCMR